MLKSKEVIVKWSGSNRKWYESKGYVYTKPKDEFIVKVEDLSVGSSTLVEVDCDCEHCTTPISKKWTWKDYLVQVKEEGKTYCNRCASIIAKGYNFVKETQPPKIKLPYITSFEKWCLDNNKQSLLDLWDYNLNKVNPSEIGVSFDDKIHFKCANNLHSSEQKSIVDLVYYYKGDITCKQCGENISFKDWCDQNHQTQVLLRWDYELNNCSPSEISHKTIGKYYFKCPRGLHSSEQRYIYTFTCGNVEIDCNQCNSFAQFGIDTCCDDFLEKYWDYENNKTNPFMISKRSHSKVWLRCQKTSEPHNNYKTSCHIFEKGCRCPMCARERKESVLQEKVREYLNKLNYTVLHEHTCTIIPINPRTNCQLPFDNEIILQNGKRLIIEVHGEQHYKITYFHKLTAKRKNTTPKEELYQQKLRDRYKRMFAHIKGYEYLEISYLTDNVSEEYRILIDEKIQKLSFND